MEMLHRTIQDQGSWSGFNFQHMVLHHEYVNAKTRLSDLYDLFKNNGQDYMAVEDHGAICGLCSRIQTGFLLGSRFGFSVMGKKTVWDHMIHDPLYLRQGQSLEQSLDRALNRPVERFYEDVILLDEQNHYLGIIPVPYLVKLQNHLMMDNYHSMELQAKEMRERLDEMMRDSVQKDPLFENKALGILCLDSDRRIREANQKTVDLLRVSKVQDLYSHDILDWVMDHDRQRFNRYFSDIIKNTHSSLDQSQEFEFHDERGLSRFLRIHFSPTHDLQQIYLFAADSTEQHHIQKSMSHAEKTTLIESFVCGVAHELNNKLSPILGFSELLLLENQNQMLSSPAIRDQILSIRETSKEAGIVIRQLQQLSQPAHPQLDVLVLKDVLDSVLKMLRHSMASEGVFLRLDDCQEVILIYADLCQMKQLFINMVLNAIQAMKRSAEKMLEITVRLAENKVRIHFKDSGEGIRPEYIDKIFDPFFTTKNNHEGMGLGLSICQSIIHHHRGEIYVQSRPQEGSLFTVVLPICVSDEVPVKISKTLETPISANLLKNSRVLVVDDEPDICKMVEGIFQSLQAQQVMSAGDHERATDLLKMYAFDWIISDLRMPHFTGIDLYDWICANVPRLKYRFIMITGESQQSPIYKKADQLKIPMIRKPFSIKGIAEAIQQQTKRLEGQLI